MKSPFLIFLPAALGAAGIYLLAQPGQREDLIVSSGAPDGSYSGGNPWGAREWGGTRQHEDPSVEEDVLRSPDHSRSRAPSGLGAARRSLRDKETEAPDFGSEVGPIPPSPLSRGKARHSRGDLERRAAQVEREANRELERLIPILGLSETQQQRIFAVLVRHSVGFDPEMRVETASETILPEDGNYFGATKDEELYASLDADQQVVMEELYEDQTAWWQDVVEQLVPDSEIPGLGGGIPPVMADDKPAGDIGTGKDVTGTVRPSSP
jgi:hypothetical protein